MAIIDRKSKVLMISSILNALALLIGSASVVWVIVYLLQLFQVLPFSGLPRIVVNSFVQTSGRTDLFGVFLFTPICLSLASVFLSRLIGRRSRMFLIVIALFAAFFIFAYLFLVPRSAALLVP